jgi:spermidine synthase
VQPLYLGLIYVMFFLSGAAALLYEVVWVRSLSLIFGGTHLAVTTVLSVFMGGLALGSHLIGRRVDEEKNPLRLYGYLELGIALSAVLFIVLMKIYPSVYIFLAQGKDNSRLYLSFIRVVFACLALLIPTTLMGGTLPVLSRFVSGSHEKMGSHLSFLYGFNTLGAVLGAAAAGFFLLPVYSVSTTIHVAIEANVIIGAAGIILSRRVPAVIRSASQEAGNTKRTIPTEETAEPSHVLSARLVLWGIAVSGFCALGYEVLWTRILTLTIGTSVYGFTIMLVAFLTGIALGSAAYGLLSGALKSLRRGVRSRIAGFGAVEIVIGVAALLVTIYIRDLPAHSMFLRKFFASKGAGFFDARQLANLTIAFSYLVVPAFFMGVAFPLAGEVTVAYRRKIGSAVGGILTYNTVGAIFGSAVSGFVMIYVLGLERSLQILTVVNIGLGMLVMLSLLNSRLVNIAVGGLTAACIVFLAANQDSLKVWDTRYFAIFRNNQPDAFNTPEKIRDALGNTDVLFYHEGVNSTISVIKPKGGDQALLVNGKVVASSTLDDRQCQLTLGHLPMLLHKNPQKVLVVGLGTGMTLGATSVHPEVEELTLAEIEPAVRPAARTFGRYNHNVLDNPKLHIIFNDGRNFLLTTKNRYDVITADPIHPWTQGSGYLYTSEYFRIAAEHLRPGGIMCQWLPIYEMSVADLKSVVRTFSLHFNYTMTWLTQYDAEIIGSNSPIAIDEAALEKRISFPAVREDLRQVKMGTAEDFLSYFVMGTEAMQRFGRDGIINTDDNLYLEFSTPASLGRNVMGGNVMALAQYRESIIPYLVSPPEGKARDELMKRWENNMAAAAIEDRAHALFLAGQGETGEFRTLMAELGSRYPEFAPGIYLEKRYRFDVSMVPTLLRQAHFTFLTHGGRKTVLELSAVLAPAGTNRGAVMFVDNAAKKIYGQKYFSGDDRAEKMDTFAAEVLSAVQTVYRAEAGKASGQGREFPAEDSTLPMIAKTIQKKTSRKSHQNDFGQHFDR